MLQRRQHCRDHREVAINTVDNALWDRATPGEAFRPAASAWKCDAHIIPASCHASAFSYDGEVEARRELLDENTQSDFFAWRPRRNGNERKYRAGRTMPERP